MFDRFVFGLNDHHVNVAIYFVVLSKIIAVPVTLLPGLSTDAY